MTKKEAMDRFELARSSVFISQLIRKEINEMLEAKKKKKKKFNLFNLFNLFNFIKKQS